MDIQKDTPSKQRILETGVVMFASKGFDGTGMRELAEHAGVNLAMINYFFGTKKGLLKVILDTFFSQYVEIAEQEFQSEGTMDEKIQRFIRHIIPFVSDNQDYLIVVLTELPHDDPDIIEHKLKWIKKSYPLCRMKFESRCQKITAVQSHQRNSARFYLV